MWQQLIPRGDAGQSADMAFLLFDGAVKSLLLLTATLIAARMMQNRSAAAAHRLWALGFAGCLLISLITVVAPAWRLPILPPPAAASAIDGKFTTDAIDDFVGAPSPRRETLAPRQARSKAEAPPTVDNAQISTPQATATAAAQVKSADAVELRPDRTAEFPETSFDPTDRVQASWFLDPHGYNWLATRENYFVKLAPDGRFRVSGVPPGQYDLVLRLYEQPAGRLVETVGEKVVPIVVPDGDVAAGTQDVGTIEVECRAGPRIGEDMRIFRFIDASGREHSIADVSGQFVLMHVWASWCAPCLESMPDVASTVERLADAPIAFVGLNIDKDRAQGKALAEKRGWNWSQNYLGDDSDMARQLAISSAPTYYLIGPDGKLVASATEWAEIKERLEAGFDDLN